MYSTIEEYVQILYYTPKLEFIEVTQWTDYNHLF